MELASTFQSSPGRPATRMLSISKRVRNILRKADKPQFVSAFCQSNCGDVSPNVLGAFCIDTGLPCEFNHSTCNGKNELCYGRGPGYVLFPILELNEAYPFKCICGATLLGRLFCGAIFFTLVEKTMVKSISSISDNFFVA